MPLVYKLVKKGSGPKPTAGDTQQKSILDKLRIAADSWANESDATPEASVQGDDDESNASSNDEFKGNILVLVTKHFSNSTGEFLDSRISSKRKLKSLLITELLEEAAEAGIDLDLIEIWQSKLD